VSARVSLGAWTSPSENYGDVYLEPDVGGRWRCATCEWASPPPLSVEDELYYLMIVLPALTRRAQEFLERPGPALMLLLGEP
jgi:hypothetical protein